MYITQNLPISNVQKRKEGKDFPHPFAPDAANSKSTEDGSSSKTRSLPRPKEQQKVKLRMARTLSRDEASQGKSATCDQALPGANPTTFEYAAATPALYVVGRLERFSKKKKNIFHKFDFSRKIPKI
jgi:hypothetical protein